MDAGRIPRPPGGADARAGHVTASTATIHIDRAPMPTRSPQQPPPPGPPHERPAPRPARRRERPRGRLGRAVPPPPRPAPRSPPRPPAWPPPHRHAPPPRRPSPAPPPAPARRAVRSPCGRRAARSSRNRSTVASRRAIRSPSRPLSAVAAAGRPSGCGWPSLDRGRPASTRISRPRLPLRLVMVPRRASERSRSGFQPVARAASGTASHARRELGRNGPVRVAQGPSPRTPRPVGRMVATVRRPCATFVPGAIGCPHRTRGWAARRPMLSAARHARPYRRHAPHRRPPSPRGCEPARPGCHPPRPGRPQRHRQVDAPAPDRGRAAARPGRDPHAVLARRSAWSARRLRAAS